MAPEPTPTDSSDVPPYTPTGLISPSIVFATHDPAGTNETATADPVIANEASKPGRRRREDCPLSSHSWVVWVLWLYCSALFSVEIVELMYWNSWSEESERHRLRRVFKWALAFTYLNTVITGLAVWVYLPLMLWNHYFIHYPGKYEISSIFVDNFFATYFVAFSPLRAETYLWFSIPLILLFAYSGFLRCLRYKKNRDNTPRDPAANAQIDGIIERRNSTVEANARNIENQ